MSEFTFGQQVKVVRIEEVGGKIDDEYLPFVGKVGKIVGVGATYCYVEFEGQGRKVGFYTTELEAVDAS